MTSAKIYSMYEAVADIVTEDYTIKVSSLLKKKNVPESIQQNFLDFEDCLIHLPDKFLQIRNF